MTVDEGNKLIEEFKGNIVDTESYNAPLVSEPSGNYYYLHESKYHFSWDWLMPVVEKIHSVADARIWYDGDFDIFDLGLNAKIDIVWQAVVKFLTWYSNTQKQTQ